MAIKNSTISGTLSVDIPTLTLTGAFSISFKFVGGTINNGLLGHSSDANKVITLSGPNLFIRVVNGGGSINVSETFNTGWNTLVIKRDSSNNVTYSLNGATFTGSLTSSGNSIWERLGYSTGQGSWDDGYAEYCFWDGYEITQEQANAIHAGCSPFRIATTSIARYYPLNEFETDEDGETTTTFRDLSVNRQHGSETGGTATRHLDKFPHPPVNRFYDLGARAIEADAGTGPVIVTKTLTIDVVLKNPDKTKTLTLDTVFQNTNKTKTITLDAIFQKLDKLKTLTFDTVLQKIGNTKTVTIDSIFRKLNKTKTFTFDSVLSSGIATTKTLTLDVVFQKLNQTKTLTIDTVTRKLNLSKTFTIDTVLRKLNQTKTLTIDAIFRKLNQNKTFTIDAVLAAVVGPTKTFTMDAVLKKLGKLKNLTIDVVIGNISSVFNGKTVPLGDFCGDTTVSFDNGLHGNSTISSGSGLSGNSSVDIGGMSS